MVNGAFFVPSGSGVTTQYAMASSVEPKSAADIEQLTLNAGVLGGPRYFCALLITIPVIDRNKSNCCLYLTGLLFDYLLFPG